MIKKYIASAAVAAGLTISSVAASAAPIAFESADRAASPIAGSEEIEGFSELWLVILFALIAAGIIVLIENNEGTTVPASP